MKISNVLKIVAVTSLAVLFLGGVSARKGNGQKKNRRGEEVEVNRTYYKRVKSVVPLAYEKEMWYTDQCVDHFGDKPCSKKWSQKYMENGTWYQKDGPLFFMFGAESHNTDDDIDDFIWNRWARKHGAYMIHLEHRFYGESFPTNGTTAEDYKLLTSHQQLEDSVRFIKWFKNKTPGLANAKVVAFGGSYPGALVTWVRELYPDVVNVGVASSAPLEYKYNFPEYYQTNADVIQEIDSYCYDQLKMTFDCMQNILDGKNCADTSITNMNDIPNAVNDCSDGWDFTDPLQREGFMRSMSFNWATNYPGTDNNASCQLLDQVTSAENGDILLQYGDFRKNDNLTKGCRVNHRRGKNNSRNRVMYHVKWFNQKNGVTKRHTKHHRDYNSWWWQTCNEFGNFQISVPLFANSWTATPDADNCNEVFPDAGFTHKRIRKNIVKTNERYGARKNYNGTCTIFVNGSWDPWHHLGFKSQEELPAAVRSKNTVIYVKGTDHCADMIDDDYDNPPNLVDAQHKINDLIYTYLNDPNCS